MNLLPKNDRTIIIIFCVVVTFAVLVTYDATQKGQGLIALIVFASSGIMMLVMLSGWFDDEPKKEIKKE